MNNEQITESSPAFYAVIPAHVRYDLALTPSQKLLYGEISALCNKEGYCWASNQYFAKLYGVKRETISGWISALEATCHIKLEYESGISRHIFLIEKQLVKTLN